MISVSDWVENIIGKEENAGNQHFLLFPQCFQKVSVSGSGLCGKELTISEILFLYQTEPSPTGRGGVWKHYGKRRKCKLSVSQFYPKVLCLLGIRLSVNTAFEIVS